LNAARGYLFYLTISRIGWVDQKLVATIC